MKHNLDGFIEYKNAQLVVRGFDQIARLYYSMTSNHMVKSTTIRTVLSLLGFHEEVYMIQSQGFIHPNYPYHVYKLKKSL